MRLAFWDGEAKKRCFSSYRYITFLQDTDSSVTKRFHGVWLSTVVVALLSAYLKEAKKQISITNVNWLSYWRFNELSLVSTKIVFNIFYYRCKNSVDANQAGPDLELLSTEKEIPRDSRTTKSWELNCAHSTGHWGVSTMNVPSQSFRQT